MSNHIEYLKSTYKQKVKPGVIIMDEMLDKLKKRFDIKPMSMNAISQIYIHMMKLNISYQYTEEEREALINNMEFIGYQVIRNSKSQEYYDEKRASINISDILNDETDKDKIIILLDKNMPFDICNSDKIAVELATEWGISQYDNETEQLVTYLENLYRLDHWDSFFV